MRKTKMPTSTMLNTIIRSIETVLPGIGGGAKRDIPSLYTVWSFFTLSDCLHTGQTGFCASADTIHDLPVCVELNRARARKNSAKKSISRTDKLDKFFVFS